MDSTKTKMAKAAHDQEQLPWEMVEEILSHVPPVSLVRLRTVCRRWNELVNDETFINNHKLTFRFILTTKSKIYSVSVDPKIVVRELTLGIEESQIIKRLAACDDFLLCGMDQGGLVLNPWLKQSRWIGSDVSQPSFRIMGIGYANNNMRAEERRYKTTGLYWRTEHSPVWQTQDFSSDVWKRPTFRQGDKPLEKKVATFFTRCGVSLHGNMYWIAFFAKTDPVYHIVNFDFSRERFYTLFCDLPCGMSHPRDALLLRVFMGDRFSLLRQCHVTKKIEIWVTKNEINVEDGKDVVWVNFVTFSIPNFPGLISKDYEYYSQPSYYMDNKRLVICSCDETGKPWIYVVEENKLISKVQLNSVVDPWPLHCTYFPSLVPVPGGP